MALHWEHIGADDFLALWFAFFQRQVLLPDRELGWVAPAWLVLLFQKCQQRNGWILEYPLRFDIWGHPFMFHVPGPKVFQLRYSVSGNYLNKCKPRGDFQGKFKNSPCFGCSNPFSHWTSVGALIILVFECGMNFPASWEQQQQKFPQQTPGCLRLLFSSQRADRILFCQLKSYQQYWTIRLEGTVLNSCSLKAWKLTKAILVGAGRGGGWREWGLEGTIQKWRGWFGGVCFPDSFQRKEICVVCQGLRRKHRTSWCSFLSNNTFSGTFLLG